MCPSGRDLKKTWLRKADVKPVPVLHEGIVFCWLVASLEPNIFRAKKLSGLVYFTGVPKRLVISLRSRRLVLDPGSQVPLPRSELFLEATLLLLEALPRGPPFTLPSVRAKNSDCEDRPCSPYAGCCRLCVEMGGLTALCLSVPICAVSTIIRGWDRGLRVAPDAGDVQ